MTNHEIINTRLFDVPRTMLFAAFCDPSRLAQWWGPNGFTNTFHEFDFRPDGYWRFVMHGPDGALYEIENQFIEIVLPDRIIFRHLQFMHQFQMKMMYQEEGGKTRLTWILRFESASECERVRSFVSQANEENFDRLEAFLATV